MANIEHFPSHIDPSTESEPEQPTFDPYTAEMKKAFELNDQEKKAAEKKKTGRTSGRLQKPKSQVSDPKKTPAKRSRTRRVVSANDDNEPEITFDLHFEGPKAKLVATEPEPTKEMPIEPETPAQPITPEQDPHTPSSPETPIEPEKKELDLPDRDVSEDFPMVKPSPEEDAVAAPVKPPHETYRAGLSSAASIQSWVAHETDLSLLKQSQETRQYAFDQLNAMIDNFQENHPNASLETLVKDRDEQKSLLVAITDRINSLEAQSDADQPKLIGEKSKGLLSKIAGLFWRKIE